MDLLAAVLEYNARGWTEGAFTPRQRRVLAMYFREIEPVRKRTK